MVGVRVELLSDPVVFAERVQAVITADPFSTNVLTGVMTRARDRPSATDALWMVVVDHGNVVGAAMHTPPYHPFLPRLPDQADRPGTNRCAESARVVIGYALPPR